MKLRWREIQSLHVLATDLTTGWIGVLSPLGLDGETRVGRGMTHYIDDHLVPNQRPPPPMLGNMTKHPMFDLIPLPGPRRKVPDVERDTELIGELLAFSLPQPIATGIAPPAMAVMRTAWACGYAPLPICHHQRRMDATAHWAVS